MPLSEEEQRVFAEIERQLVIETPRRVRRRVGSRVGRLAWQPSTVAGPSAALVASLTFAGATVGIHPLLAVVGFGGMLAAISLIVHRLGASYVHAIDGGPRRHPTA